MDDEADPNVVRQNKDQMKAREYIANKGLSMQPAG